MITPGRFHGLRLVLICLHSSPREVAVEFLGRLAYDHAPYAPKVSTCGGKGTGGDHMGVRAGGLLRRAGAVSILTAGVFLFTVGMLPVQAAARHAKSAPTAPSCGHQANLNDPTNSTNKVLDGYWFAIGH